MKVVADTKTLDLEGVPGVRRQRGRPATGEAKTAAQRKKEQRERLVSEGKVAFSCVLPIEVVEALDKFLQFKDETKDQLVERVLRDRLLRKR